MPTAEIASTTKQPPITNKPAKIAVAPINKAATPVQAAPTQPATPVFDPSNPATWPHCAANQFVRADNGQCADNSVQAPAVATTAAATTPVGQTYSGCGDNFYANYIYMHESGCSTYNPNPSSGACGLGQAEPCSKLESACPGMDYACENAWFTSYANKYGGWAGAYDFWVNNHWW